MADDKQNVDTSDSVRHGDEDARKAAKERMDAALAAQKAGKEVEVDEAGIESSKEDAAVSGGTKSDDKKLDSNGKQSLNNVKVYSPFHVYFDGDANSISAENLTGPFDVLFGHKNFMSLLIPCELVVRPSRGEERIKIDRGIMHVRDNKVSVFLDV